MKESINEFFSALNHEEQCITEQLFKDELGVIIKAAFCELDLAHSPYGDPQPPNVRGIEQRQLQLGAVRLAHLVLHAGPPFTARGVSFRRNADYTKLARNTLLCLGAIQYGRQLAQGAMAGLSKIERGSAPSSFEFLINSDLLPTAEFEQQLSSLYARQHENSISEALRLPIFKAMRKKIDVAFRKHVRVFEKHFIGYDSTPLLDHHFFAVAYQLLQRFEGFDSFHFRLRFGGIPFQNYILALAYYLSCALRHEAFCRALVEKHRGIKIVDILTVTLDYAPYVEDLRRALNEFGKAFESFEPISKGDAELIFEVLSSTRNNAKSIANPGAPLAPHIRTTDETFIRSLTGAWNEPTRFLIESLKFHFPSDFDKNQTTREESLRRAAIRVLSTDMVDLEFLQEIKIRSNGAIATDIDLVIIERSTGSIVLCQLKHQDSYGMDVGGEILRSQRLIKQVRNWLDIVHAWSTNDHDVIRSSLQLPKSFVLSQIYTLTIARHFAHPLRDVCKLQLGDLYCNFVQLIDCLSVLRGSNDRTWKALAHQLQSIPVQQANMRAPRRPIDKWRIGNVKFSVRDLAQPQNEAEDL